MIPLKLRRRYLRAPLHTNFLYKDLNCVSKGKIENISEGGALLSLSGNLDDKVPFRIYIDLPEVPNFSNMPISEIYSLGKESFKHHVFHAEMAMRRATENNGSYMKRAGCEFVNIEIDDLKAISLYVQNYASSIVFVLSLFEQGVHRKDVHDLIRKTLGLLNYPETEKLAELRQKLLHDYQSLESL